MRDVQAIGEQVYRWCKAHHIDPETNHGFNAIVRKTRQLLRSPTMKYHIELSQYSRGTLWTAVPAKKPKPGLRLFTKKEATIRARIMNKALFLFIAEQSKQVAYHPAIPGKQEDHAALAKEFLKVSKAIPRGMRAYRPRERPQDA